MAREGQTATGPNGERAVFRNGQWVIAGQATPQASNVVPSDPRRAQAFDAQESREEQANRRAEEANARAEEAERRAEAAEERAARKEGREQDAVDARGGVDTTESERTASFLATRVAGGIQMLGRVGEQGAPSYWEKIAGDSALGNYVTDEERQRVVAAQIDILDAALTLGTGAAYTREQIEGYRLSHFPRPGDKPATIADKRDRLKILLEGARVKAGGAAPLIDNALQGSGVFSPKAKNDQQDTPPALGLANPGDTSKSIPIPAQMQGEYQAGLRGVRNADDFARLRDSLDQKYGFQPNTPDQMQSNRDYWNKLNGKAPKAIPPANAKMQGIDRLNSGIFNNRAGAALAAAPVFAPVMDEMAGGFRSIINGTDYNVERDIANASRQALQEQYPGSSLAGGFAGGLIGGGALAKAAPRLADITSRTALRAGGTGAGLGAFMGTGEMNDDRAAGAMYGAGFGAGGAAAGRAVAPLLDKISSTRPVRTIARYGNQAANAVRRQPVAYESPPRLSRTDQAVGSAPIADIRRNVTDAQSLGLPYTLADATPQTRALAGSAARFSPKVRQLADDVLTSRQDERPERAINAVGKYMAKPVNPADRRKELLKAGSVASSPLYEETFARAAPIGDDVAAILRTQTGKEALQRAYKIAENEGYDPMGIGFDLDMEGNVKMVEKPSLRSLDMVKRGIDSLVEDKRNPTTGVLDLQGDPMAQSLDKLRKRLIQGLDTHEPKYKEARAEYAEYAKRAEALDRGYKAPPRNVRLRDMQQGMQGLKPEALDEMRSGYATRVVDDIANTEQGDPMRLFYGKPGSTTSARREKVGTLFPDAVPKLDRMSALERDMANTYQEVLGGSQTQPRNVADQQFAGRGGDLAVNAAIDASTSGMPVATGMGLARNLIRDFADRRNLGGMAAEGKAEEIGPGLLGQGPESILSYLDELESRQREVMLRRAQFNRAGGMLGSFVGSGASTAGY